MSSEQVKIETPAELREAIGIDQLRERIEELEQDNKRLEDALEDIANVDKHFVAMNGIEGALNLIVERAQFALEEQEE